MVKGQHQQAGKGKHDVNDQGSFPDKSVNQPQQDLGEKEITEGQGSQDDKSDETIDRETEEIGNIKGYPGVRHEAQYNIGKNKSDYHQGRQDESRDQPAKPFVAYPGQG